MATHLKLQKPNELGDCLISHHELNQAGTEPANVVDGLFAIAHSLEQVARAIRDLGNADAATPMGAIEALGLAMKDGLGSIAIAIEDHTREGD